jgi:hypothetical protein
MSRMAQPDQGFGMQLTGTFAADPEVPADLPIEAAALPIQSVAGHNDALQPFR